MWAFVGKAEVRDNMTREEAIVIIRKEYQCVDRDCDIERSCGKCDLMIPSKEPILQAYEIAIKALENEPILDKIKEEFSELVGEYTTQEIWEIIDKYKQESNYDNL